MRALATIALTVVALRAIGAAAPAGRAAGDPARTGGATDADRADRADREAADPRRGSAERTGPEIAVPGPPIGAVLTAAYAAAGLDRDLQRGWVRRTRLAGLVPWVTVRTTRDTSWQDAHAEVGHGASLELRATWRLDRLLFDGKELQAATIDAARRRERRRLAAQVIRAYFAWRRAASAATAATAASTDERAEARVAEAVAELDALTDGWFSDQLSRPPAAGP